MSVLKTFAIRDVTNIANMLTISGIFFILLYFPHLYSNMKLVLLFKNVPVCHDKVFEVNVFRPVT